MQGLSQTLSIGCLLACSSESGAVPFSPLSIGDMVKIIGVDKGCNAGGGEEARYWPTGSRGRERFSLLPADQLRGI